MSQFKARLSVVLKANEVVVAESEDPGLWQRVLAAINSGSTDSLGALPAEAPGQMVTPPPAEAASVGSTTKGNGPLSQFAARLGLTSETVEGACAPTLKEPFLHLDMHAWSAVKQQLPERGTKALSPIAVAGTLLALWAKEAGLATPTQSQALKVLATISLQDKNPSRGIRSSTWLQARPGGQIVLNPASIQKALLLAKCFCSQDWKPWKATED